MKIAHLLLLAITLCLLVQGQSNTTTSSEPASTTSTSSEPSSTSSTTTSEPAATSSTTTSESSGTASEPEPSSSTTTSASEPSSTQSTSTSEQSSTASEPEASTTTQSEPSSTTTTASSEPSSTSEASTTSSEPSSTSQTSTTQEEPAQTTTASSEPSSTTTSSEPSQTSSTTDSSTQDSTTTTNEEPASTQSNAQTSSSTQDASAEEEETAAASSSSAPTSVKKFLDSFDESTQAMQCHIYTDSKFYDLTKLMNKENDYSVTSLTSGYHYVFNFCRYALNPCGTSTKSYAYQVLVLDPNDCAALSDSEKNPSQSRQYEKLSIEGTTSYHLEYTLDGGEACSRGGSTVSFDIQCNLQETGTPQFFVDDLDICNPLIYFEHQSGCPAADLTSIWDFILRNPWVLALFGIFIGPFVNFYGHRFLPWVIGVLSGGMAALFVFVFCGYFGLTTYFYYEDTASASPEEGLYALLTVAVCFFAGLGVGYFMKEKFLTLGFIVLGAIAGVFLGAILFSLIIIHFYDEEWVLILSIVVLGLVGGIVAYKLKDGVMIIVTSFIGAYMFVRGISVFVGGYPGELEMINMVKTGTYDLTIYLICYLIGVFVLFVWGICFQNRHRKESDEHFHTA